MPLAETMTCLLLLYSASGLAFGFAFVRWGVDSIDAEARGAPLGFRVIILPGVVAFWPVLVFHWVNQHRQKGPFSPAAKPR